MTRFRPCIDLHEGRVKQIVGSTLTDGSEGLHTNFVSDQSPASFADRYRRDGLMGGHVIMLGPGNEEAACAAAGAFPGGLHIGGGIRPSNAERYLNAGGSHVIVTSYLFTETGEFSWERLQEMVKEVGKDRLVIDLSCRAVAGGGWKVAMNRWQTMTDLEVTPSALAELASHCAEFLVHAVDVEGKCEGIDHELAAFLGNASPIPVTYAGGISTLEDLVAIDQVSSGRVDGTVGSALDIFGGQGVRYQDCVAFNARESASPDGR